MKRLPPWIRIKWATEGEYAKVHQLVSGLELNTVCQDAKCPNIHECWNRGTATFMILGDLCTRTCGFCAIKGGRPQGLDREEPERVAEAAASMHLNHVVVTSVARDDLPDGGAQVFADTIRALKRALPGATIEILTPDFQGRDDALEIVLAAEPDVFNHNLETVQRLQPVIRPMASYGRTLSVLTRAAAYRTGMAVKSGLMLGLGETEDEILDALRDLRRAGCDLLTIGQYLAPTPHHREVDQFVPPETFDRIGDEARNLGFKGVASGPMVRSSYRADELFAAYRCATHSGVA